MRRWIAGWVIAGALVLGVLGLLRAAGSPDTSAPEQAAPSTVIPRASRASAVAASQRPGAGLRIRGTVVDTHGAPVAGARVSASWPEPGQTLSELPCPEGAVEPYEDPRDPSTRGRKLPECMSHVTALVLELVGAREGEAPVYAEATTGAEGTFLLDALPEGPLTLWALGEHGAVMRAGIPAGSEGVELVLDEGLTLEATVAGDDGAPLAGATVTVLNAWHTRFFDTTTGADGRFRVGPLPYGGYFAFVAKDGWLPALEELGREEQEVTLHRPSRLSGRVLSEGAPVPGIEVRVTSGEDLPGGTARSLTTDAQGRFSLVLPAGPHVLSASRDGRYALAHVTAGTGPAEVVLELGSALHVEGRVSDDAGRPVAGARVIASSRSPSEADLEALTGADGNYRLGPVEPGPWRFRVEAAGYLDLREDAVRTLGAAPERLDFTLTRAASVTGRVTDAEGHPLPDLQLTFLRPGNAKTPGEGEPQEGAWTDAEGRFVLDADAPGNYRIEVTDAPFLDATFPVRAPSQDVHLTLHAGASVEGSVADAHGLLMEDFLVELQDPEGREELPSRRVAFTDAKGHFLLQGVKPGRYLLLASSEERALTRRAWREVELRDGARTQVELRVEPERTLSGLVVDGTGTPVKAAFVRAHPPQEDAPAWKREGRHSRHGPPAGVATDADGRFTIRGLTEAAYDVRIAKAGHELDTVRSTGGLAGTDKDSLRVGADTAEVRVVLARQPHVVGRLMDPDGAPVRAFRMNGQPVEDAEGAFALPMEYLGETGLVFEADGLAPRVLPVKPRQEGGDLDLGVLRMSRGRTLRGRVVDAETAWPVPFAQLMLTPRSSNPEEHAPTLPVEGAGEDGTFTLSHLDPDTFTLTVNRPGYRQLRLTVSSDQEEVTLRLEPGARVEVSVKDRQGRLRAARVQFRGDSGSFESVFVEKGQHVQRGLEPGPYTVRVEAEDERLPVFLPQRVVVPARGLLQVPFQEQEGGITVKLSVPGGTSSYIMLCPGGMPPPSRKAEVARVFGQSHPGEQNGDDATFQHVPPGPATVVFIHPYESTRYHWEQLDIPETGTLSRVLSPVWRTFDAD
ncbi:carboxypeptidase-like regulatory domain-containing protein [Pyxidicoccus sp. MSG2]|uniref:carboxypeptidase-like regulatory domain-containing protein n=1 Tax=Pyxidicoccus sp. MSG2 TaxID=2996790 RepID=UPI002271A119|nr:carboxypeptidase-like regulatory domain-containing protein [Pyxidicoccus sp. MSG2]MCY1018004.1 carboxypeptidase-like regulatory domain-containing protein [Pyxidicoccus sp. MSG2]